MNTAVILVGYQNDYFGQDGLLNQVVEESSIANSVIQNTVNLLTDLPKSTLVITTPILFSQGYQELENPVGILKQIQDLGALQAGTLGAQMIEELEPFADRIIEINGKRGFNAFAHTHLDEYLRSKDINHVIIAGTITSICIDSTGRFAHELGYDVTILSDCTAARTNFEQDFYCDSIFPVYANVMTQEALLQGFAIAA